MFLSLVVVHSFLLIVVHFCEMSIFFCSAGGLSCFLILAFRNSVAENLSLSGQVHAFVLYILGGRICCWAIGCEYL